MSEDIVVMNAKDLHHFFFGYEFDDVEERTMRESLLEEVPNGCNFKFNPITLVAEVTTWEPTARNLQFLLSLHLCVGCELQVTSAFYDKLRPLSKVQGTLLGWTLPRARPPKKSPPAGISYILSRLGLL